MAKKDAKAPEAEKVKEEQEMEAPVAEQQAPPAEKPAAPSFPSDRWIYSEDKEPMILRKGTPLPEGFTTDRKAIKTVWENTATGKWVKK